MFNWLEWLCGIDPRTNELQNKIIDDLTKDVKFLKEENSRLRTVIKSHDDSFMDCSTFLNLDIFDIFSIERSIVGTGIEKTVVTVILRDKNNVERLKEWYFDIPRAAHERLVAKVSNHFNSIGRSYANTIKSLEQDLT